MTPSEYYELDKITARIKASLKVVESKAIDKRISDIMEELIEKDPAAANTLCARLAQLYASAAYALEDAEWFTLRMLEIAEEGKAASE